MNDPLVPELAKAIKMLNGVVQGHQKLLEFFWRTHYGEELSPAPAMSAEELEKQRREIAELNKLFGQDNDLPPAA